jgi:hypothetical protein
MLFFVPASMLRPSTVAPHSKHVLPLVFLLYNQERRHDFSN